MLNEKAYGLISVLLVRGIKGNKKYLASIMLGHAKADTVVHEMLKTLEKLALLLKLVLSLGMDGPNVNKSILGKLDEKKKEKGAQSVVLFMCVTIASAKE